MIATNPQDATGALVMSPVSAIRSRAAADIRTLRALARTAEADGLPQADLRAANARRAARSVLDHARRLSSFRPLETGATRPSEMVD